VVDFGTNRKHVYDFLLVINSNIGPILHRFGDTVVYWWKNRQFTPTPVSEIALARGDPYRISGWAGHFQKLECSGSGMVKKS